MDPSFVLGIEGSLLCKFVFNYLGMIGGVLFMFLFLSFYLSHYNFNYNEFIDIFLWKYLQIEAGNLLEKWQNKTKGLETNKSWLNWLPGIIRYGKLGRLMINVLATRNQQTVQSEKKNSKG